MLQAPEEIPGGIARSIDGSFLRSVNQDGTWVWERDATPTQPALQLNESQRGELVANLNALGSTADAVDGRWDAHPQLEKHRLCQRHVDMVLDNNHTFCVVAMDANGEPTFDTVSRDWPAFGAEALPGHTKFHGCWISEGADYVVGRSAPDATTPARPWLVVDNAMLFQARSLAVAAGRYNAAMVGVFEIGDEDIGSPPPSAPSPSPTSISSPGPFSSLEPSGSPAAPLHLHVSVQVDLPDNPLAFARGGGPLLAAVMDGSIDVACSGATASAWMPVKRVRASDGTELSRGSRSGTQTLAIALDPSAYVMDQGVVRVQERYMALVDLTVGSVTSSGSLCDAHGGFGSAPLPALLEAGGVALVGLRFDVWDQLMGTVVLSNATLRSGADLEKSPVVPHVIVSDASASANIDKAMDIFGNAVMAATELRTKRFIYAPSKFLSKTFVSGAIGYTPVDAIMHINSGMDADQLEDGLAAMARTVLGEEEEAHSRFLDETSVPGPAAVAYGEAAAMIYQRLVRVAIDYHVDGVARQDPNGRMGHTAAESWLEFAPRTPLKQSDDCDYSGMQMLRTGRQIGLSPYGDHRYAADGTFESLDPGHDPARHRYTRGIRNALGFTHTLGFAIVGATTGEGTKVDHAADGQPKTAPQAQGHAVPLLIPSAHLLRALERGADLPPTASFGVLYPPGKLAVLPAEHRPQSLDDLQTMPVSLAEVHAMSIDGTVTSAPRLHYEGDERRKRSYMATREKAASKRLGTLMGQRPVDLSTVGAGGSHGFYLHFVELTIPGAFGDDATLQAAGTAATAATAGIASGESFRGGKGTAHTFVVAPWSSAAGKTVEAAGATPKQMDAGEYSLVPLVPLDATSGPLAVTLRKETLLHTLAPRPPTALAVAITAAERDNADRSAAALRSLNDRLQAAGKQQGQQSDEDVLVELHITPREMWGNPESVRQTLDRIGNRATGGSAHVHKMSSFDTHAMLGVVRAKVRVGL